MRGGGGLQLTNPQYEILDEEDAETIHTGRIVPVYERVGSVTPKMQRRLVFDALQRLPTMLPDLLPEEVRGRLGLPSRQATRAAVQAHRGAEGGAQGNRRGHAEAATHEPAAPGRRWRGQDDRRAALGAGGDGKRPPGRVHGADRDSGRTALREYLAAAACV